MQVTSAQCVVLATGGTIAGAAADPQDHLNYRAGAIGVSQLLAGFAPADPSLVCEDVAGIDSKDMSWEVWRALAARCAHWLAQHPVSGIVVTHGTDTLEETAWFLQRVLAPAKPVVLASAMRAANALSPDGPQNLADALAIARTVGAQGVLAVCAGQVHAAGEVRKLHPYRVEAFGAGETGPVALVEDGQVRRLREWPAAAPTAGLLERVLGTSQPPRVEIVSSHAGADGRMVDLLVADGVQGLVVAGTGNGSLHQRLEQALARAQAQGVRVVRSTRCLLGRVVPQAGTPFPAHALPPPAARVDLQLDLLA